MFTLYLNKFNAKLIQLKLEKYISWLANFMCRDLFINFSYYTVLVIKGQNPILACHGSDGFHVLLIGVYVLKSPRL